MTEENKKTESLSGKLVSGAGWTVGIRWTSKALGIISLAICARILTPADYGLVSMATVVFGFASLLVELGVETSLIQAKNPSTDLYNTAWSLRVIQRCFIALITFIAAPVAAHFYSDNRITLIMVAVGIAELICAFENIYTVNLRKHLNFRSDFLYMAIPRFTSFVVAIFFVIVLENYWGLVIGICTTELVRTIVSYIIVSDRPKWSLTKWRDIFGFSTWYMLKGLGDFVSNESDRLILGILGGPKATGLFNVAKEVATLPVTELVLPIGRALTPTLAKISGDKQRLSSAIEKSISGTLLIAAPASLGFTLISSEFIILLFGHKWLDAIPILSTLCIGGIAFAIKENISNALIIINKVRVAAYLSWINATVIVSLFYPAYTNHGAIGVAWLIVCSSIFTATTSLIALARFGYIRISRVAPSLVRPIISALIMVTAINNALPIIHTTSLSIITKVILGALIYTVTLIGLWAASGKPDSSESIIISLIKEKILNHSR